MNKKLESSLLGVVSFIISLFIAWLLCAQANFFYGVWHDFGGIGEGIDRYAPQNHFKAGFKETSRAQRLEKFAQITHAIRNSGEGLEAISYQTPTSGGRLKLLTEAEVLHLQDVAHLIDRLTYLGLFVVALWLSILGFYWSRHKNPPNYKSQLKGVGITILICVALVFIIGPETLFNQLHIWVFPSEHQWFFYYQESLMSTMMLAPHLFAYIALLLLSVAIVVFIVLQWLTLYVFSKKQL